MLFVVLFPINIRNSEGVQLKEVVKQTGVATYHGTLLKDFPNLASSSIASALALELAC